MMHDKAPGTFIPCMRALYDPTFGQHDEAFGIGLDGEKVALLRRAPAPDVLVGRMTNPTVVKIVVAFPKLPVLSYQSYPWSDFLDWTIFSSSHDQLRVAPCQRSGWRSLARS